MKLHKKAPGNISEKIIDHAHLLCKEFDDTSDCRQYLNEKIAGKNTTTYYFENNQGELSGMAILEIVDRHYGNLIVHTIHEADEAFLAHALTTNNIINKNILELIQFRSNFHYRDEFIHLGLREKERVRMSHKNIKVFEQIDTLPNITFKALTIDDNKTCGTISYNAHKHRINIECYDVYSSPEKRAGFAKDLRNNKHGRSINEASLLMHFNETPIGLIEVVHTKQGTLDMGWIMDVALLPEYQGMGLGKHLIKKSLSELHSKGYTAAGLGVTMTNNSAHQLYESIGFEDYEFFVEIIGV